jgi:hypothetical protein
MMALKSDPMTALIPWFMKHLCYLRAPLGALVCLVVAAAAFAQIHPRAISEIEAPTDYHRLVYPESTFAGYMQRLPIKQEAGILDYKGGLVRNPIYDVLAVVSMPLLFKTDIEQCADWCMRFWAEYHKASRRLDRLVLFDYGGRPRQFGKSSQQWVPFLRTSMQNSNSYSLKQGCVELREKDLAPGDMIVQNTTGGIGHVSMIVDVCENSLNRRLYLIGYSFMPAQQFHIERARTEHGEEGWFSLNGYRKYLSEYLPYGPPLLRRFPEP